MNDCCIPYRDTRHFSPLLCDYIDRKKSLSPLYHHFPQLENFGPQAGEKAAFFSPEKRQLLSKTLTEQYAATKPAKIVRENIERLSRPNTFTVTTGHQLNLFTGPLYFFYKIISTANLCRKLSAQFPDKNFVPVYWMATEDHDFEEIDHFHFRGEKISWASSATGPVGRFSTEGLENTLEQFSKGARNSQNAARLIQLFKDTYIGKPTLAEATRSLVNNLFGEYGLVIVDGDDPGLKKAFAPFMEKELVQQTSFHSVSETTQKLTETGYKAQVNPRDINLFYMESGLRERIEKDKGRFQALNTDLSWSQLELIELLRDKPQHFSPNVLLRPLYQEVVLPNICYVGGGAEISYWLQLKGLFDRMEVPFPILLPRNSALLVPQRLGEKLDKLGCPAEDLFLPKPELLARHTRRISDIPIDFSPQRRHLQQQFKELYTLAKKTDNSFVGAVAAQEKKQLNGLDHLEKRLLKAQKRRLSDELERLQTIRDTLFPAGSLQERRDNFSNWYAEYGEPFTKQLFETLDPMDLRFKVVFFS